MSDDRFRDPAASGGAPRAPGTIDWPASRDLPGLPDVDPRSLPLRHSPTGLAEPAAETLDDPDARGTIVGIFGGARRSGPWEPPARLLVVSLFGGVHLDFCEAEMLEGETVVEVYALFGGAEIRVPPDIDVVTEGLGLFGHFGQRDQRGTDSQPPRLRVKGFALFGGVEIKGPRTRSRWRRRDRHD
jgi:hypothetical protein